MEVKKHHGRHSKEAEVEHDTVERSGSASSNNSVDFWEEGSSTNEMTPDEGEDFTYETEHKDKHERARDVVEASIILAECAPLTEEEKALEHAILQSVNEYQREKFTDLDLLSIVRSNFLPPKAKGTQKERHAAIIAAAQKIANFRDSIQYYSLLKHHLPNDDDFNKKWPEFVYGFDRHGHVITGFQMHEVQKESLISDYDIDSLMALLAQRWTAINYYQSEEQEKRGLLRRQRIIIMDLKGLSSSIFIGKKGKITKQLMSESNNNFPDTIFEFYAINVPLIFRMIKKNCQALD